MTLARDRVKALSQLGDGVPAREHLLAITTAPPAIYESTRAIGVEEPAAAVIDNEALAAVVDNGIVGVTQSEPDVIADAGSDAVAVRGGCDQ